MDGGEGESQPGDRVQCNEEPDEAKKHMVENSSPGTSASSPLTCRPVVATSTSIIVADNARVNLSPCSFSRSHTAAIKGTRRSGRWRRFTILDVQRKPQKLPTKSK